MMVWGSMWIFAKSNFSFYAVFTAFLVLWLKVTYRSMLPPTPKQERCKSSPKMKNRVQGTAYRVQFCRAWLKHHFDAKIGARIMAAGSFRI